MTLQKPDPLLEIQALIEEFLVLKSELFLSEKSEATIDHMIAELESQSSKEEPNLAALRREAETVKAFIQEVHLLPTG